MNATDALIASLGKLEGGARTTEFLANGNSVNRVASGCERLAVWANTICRAEPDNPSLPFLYEMQRASHDVAALLSTAFYVPAAAAMRSSCETALYYSFFRCHIAELTTLATTPSFYISKKDILEYHKVHSPKYATVAQSFGFPGLLDSWYSRLSAVVHGQVPGTWGKRLSLEDTRHDDGILEVALKTFEDGVEIIHTFFLLTVGCELWGRFHHEAKRALLKGMPAAKRSLLELDGR